MALLASVRSGAVVKAYLKAPEAACAEYPAFKDRPIGGALTLVLEVGGIEALHALLKDRASIVMEHKWYGVAEFAIADPMAT